MLAIKSFSEKGSAHFELKGQFREMGVLSLLGQNFVGSYSGSASMLPSISPMFSISLRTHDTVGSKSLRIVFSQHSS